MFHKPGTSCSGVSVQKEERANTRRATDSKTRGQSLVAAPEQSAKSESLGVMAPQDVIYGIHEARWKCLSGVRERKGAGRPCPEH
jgi:hypothetical protein